MSRSNDGNELLSHVIPIKEYTSGTDTLSQSNFESKSHADPRMDTC